MPLKYCHCGAPSGTAARQCKACGHQFIKRQKIDSVSSTPSRQTPNRSSNQALIPARRRRSLSSSSDSSSSSSSSSSDSSRPSSPLLPIRLPVPRPGSAAIVPGSRLPNATAPAPDDGNENTCALCHDEGNLLCCDSCPHSFHLSCVGLKAVPEGQWRCPLCKELDAYKAKYLSCLPAADISQSSTIPFKVLLEKALKLDTKCEQLTVDNIKITCYAAPIQNPLPEPPAPPKPIPAQETSSEKKAAPSSESPQTVTGVTAGAGSESKKSVSSVEGLAGNATVSVSVSSSSASSASDSSKSSTVAVDKDDIVREESQTKD